MFLNHPLASVEARLTDSGVSILRRQAEGMWADTLSESDDFRSAEIRSAASGGSVYVVSSQAGDTICLEEDRRRRSRLNGIGLGIHGRYTGFISLSFCIAGVNCEDRTNSQISRGLHIYGTMNLEIWEFPEQIELYERADCLGVRDTDKTKKRRKRSQGDHFAW